jgi:hypothetical protein
MRGNTQPVLRIYQQIKQLLQFVLCFKPMIFNRLRLCGSARVKPERCNYLPNSWQQVQDNAGQGKHKYLWYVPAKSKSIRIANTPGIKGYHARFIRKKMRVNLFIFM